MVIVRELRIGDLVSANGSKCTVRGIEEHQIKLDNGKVLSPDEIDPIPLSENILLQSGFVENENDQPYHEYNHDGFVINMFLIGEPVFLYCADDTFKGDTVSYSRPALKYVHQLQNVYYALTGKDLKINI